MKRKAIIEEAEDERRSRRGQGWSNPTRPEVEVHRLENRMRNYGLERKEREAQKAAQQMASDNKNNRNVVRRTGAQREERQEQVRRSREGEEQPPLFSSGLWTKRMMVKDQRNLRRCPCLGVPRVWSRMVIQERGDLRRSHPGQLND